MARVLVATQPWGTLWEKEGNGNLKVPTAGQLAEINTTVYSAATGSGEILPAAFLSDPLGQLPGHVELGTYLLDRGDGVPIQVEAVGSASDPGGRFKTEAWDDFDRANGALTGQSAPSGHVWSVTGSQAAQISTNKLVSPGAGAFYASLVLTENVGEIAADFTLEAGIGANDGMALIVNPHNTSVFTEDLIHLDWTRETWTLSVVEGVLDVSLNPLVTIATGQIVGLSDDPHRMVMALQDDLCTVTLDGVVLCAVRDARFVSLAGRRATWEIIRSSGSGLDMNFAAVSAAGYAPERKPSPVVSVASVGPAITACVAKEDPWALGMPDGAARVWTQDPRAGLVNCDGFSPGYGFYQRVYGSGRITHVSIEVITSSGNICIAVYRNNNLLTVNPEPATRIATTGGVACPAIGYQTIALDVPADIEPGDWIGYSTDTGAAVVLGTFAAVLPTFLANGFARYGGADYPLPSSTSGLSVGLIRGIAIVGS